VFQHLLNNSVADSTNKNYGNAISLYTHFANTHNMPLPPYISTTDLQWFIATLHAQNYAVATVKAYVSGIAHYCKLHGQPDPSNFWSIRKGCEGSRRLSYTHKDPRLPITADILSKIVDSLPDVATNEYEQTLFTSAFLMAYFGLLRVSELTTTIQTMQTNINRVLWINDLKINHKEVTIRLKQTKTNQAGQPIILALQAIPGSKLCPVNAMAKFIVARPLKQGPLLCHKDNSPLTPYQFTAVLTKCLVAAKVPQSHLYKAHSFRIGCASQAANNSIPDCDIKKYGRWAEKSNAYKSYIRIPSSRLLRKV